MTSTLTPTTHFMNPTSQYKRRVLLKRSTQQINDPDVVRQMKLASVKNTLKKKSVRFHDNVEQVRYFFKTQSPVSVKSDPPLMDTSADDYKLSLPNWPSRNTIFYNTEQKIRMENVQLMDGDIEHMVNNKVIVEGRCRALNLSFHKIVSIRYSFDLWRSYQETTGEFRESIASTSNTWDRFSFQIPVEAKQNIQTIYLALRYTVDDQDYWDNNNGLNYEIVITPEPIEQVVALEEEEQQVQEEEIINNQQQQQQQDDDELALNKISTKKDNTKILGRRYDFTASLTAARKPYASPPPSPPGTPIDNENFSYTPPVFFNNDSHLETTPIVYQVLEQPKKSQPIPINTPDSPPISSAEGFQMSYSDFVNKYCFYNSHSNPIYSTFSTSPSAVLS